MGRPRWSVEAASATNATNKATGAAKGCKRAKDIHEPDRSECAHGELCQHGHRDRVPVGMLRVQAAEIDLAHVARHLCGQCDAGRGDTIVRRRHSRRVGVCAILLAPSCDADNLDADCALGTSGRAGGALYLGEHSVTHVAFAHDAAFGAGSSRSQLETSPTWGRHPAHWAGLARNKRSW